MNKIYVLMLLLLLTACGGSSGGGSSTTTGGGGTTTGGSIPATIPIGGLAGAGFDGLIINGDVKVYDFTDGKKGAQLAQTVSDSTGLYSLKLQIESRPILVEVTNGYYIEEAGAGFQVKLGAGQYLSALVNYTTGSTLKVSTTSLTHMAAALAAFGINKGSSVSSAINDANGRVSGIVGFDILSTTPQMITDAANASASLTPELRYGFMAGAISMWTNDHAPTTATAHKSPYTSIDFAQLIYKDIGADGLLDGKGFDSANALVQLSFGNTPLSVDVYRHALGVSMLKMANNQNNKTGLNGASVLAFVQSYISSTDSVFNNTPPVTIAAPVVNVSAPVANAVLMKTVNIATTATTAGELSSVELLVDGVSVASASNLSAPALSLNTTIYNDGNHTLAVRATDTGGLVTVSSVPVLIVNSVPAVTITAPTPYAVLTAITTLSASTQSSIGLTEVALLLDGSPIAVSPNHTSPSFSIDTAKYTDGAHTLAVRATDVGGQITTTTVPVVIANIAPAVAITSPASTALVRGSINLTATASSNSGLATVQLYVDGNIVSSAQNLASISFAIDTTQYADGAHTLAVRATDVGGKFSTASVTGVVFDNVAPAVTVTAPTASAILRGSTQIVGAASSLAGIASVELLMDNNLVAKNISSTTFTLNTALYLDGAHTVGLRVTDIGGLVTTQTVPVIISNVAPVVTVTAPAANAILQTAITVAATTFSRAGISAVELLVDGNHTASASNFAVPTFQLQSNAYADGPHTLSVKATDIGGLVTAVDIPVVVANVPPVLNVTAPAVHAVVKGSTAITTTVQSGSGVNKVGLYVDGQFVTWALTPSAPSFSLNTTVFGDGAHTLGLSATDVGGLVTSTTVPVVFDNIAPAVTIAAPGNNSWLHGLITVSGSSSDTAGVVSTVLLVDGANAGTAASPTAPSFSIDTTTITEAAHTIALQSTDVGAGVTTTTYTVRVDNTAPTATGGTKSVPAGSPITTPVIVCPADSSSGVGSVTNVTTGGVGTYGGIETSAPSSTSISQCGVGNQYWLLPMNAHEKASVCDVAGNCSGYIACVGIDLAFNASLGLVAGLNYVCPF